jgi:hypothetical protein
MNGILDSVLAKAQTFRPESVTEYTALQLAKKLTDTGRLSKYLSLFDRYDEALILEGFINVRSRDLAGEELGVAFDRELAALTKKEDDHAL